MKVIPSNRANPALVPIHRKPSRVWSKAVTESEGNPFRVRQVRTLVAGSAEPKSAARACAVSRATPATHHAKLNSYLRVNADLML